ncbi:MAG: hypothetical protein M1831_000067 [Alyxoria varia]|nr:MAG: hypothetical protein M1831_000067 [Alyxoria varia]
MPDYNAPKHAFVEDCDSDSDTHPANPQPPSPKIKPKPAFKPSGPKPRPVRPPSNHSDSGYSSKTAATVGSGESSKGSGKKTGALRVDTKAARANADVVPRERGNDKSKGKSSDPNGKPAPKKGPTQKTAGQREVMSPDSPANPQQHPTGFQYPPHGAAPSPWHMQFAAQHPVPPPQPMHGSLPPGVHSYPTPTTSFPPSAFPPTGPTDAPIPRPRRHSLSMAGSRPASYHPGTSNPGYWVDLNSGTPVESSPSPMFSPAYIPSGPISSSYPTQGASSMMPQRISGPSHNQMLSPASQQRPALPHRSTIQSGSPSIGGPDHLAMYEGNQMQPTRTARPPSQVYPDSYMAQVPNDRTLMPPPPRPPAQSIAVQQLLPDVSRRNSLATQAIPQHVWAQADAGYLDGDETIRPSRKESKRPGILDSRSTSFQAPVPAKRPDIDRTPSRVSGYTTKSYPGYESRAELDKRRARDAEAYMGRISGRSDQRDSRPSKEISRTHSATTGQPLTAKALEKRTSYGPTRNASSGTHSRSHSHSHGYSKSRGSSKDEDNSRMSQASASEASGAVKIRLPAKERLDLEFSGGMDGRTISYGPTDEIDGMAELVIGDRGGGGNSQEQARRGSIASSTKGSFAERSAKMSSKGSEKAKKTKKTTDGNKAPT